MVHLFPCLVLWWVRVPSARFRVCSVLVWLNVCVVARWVVLHLGCTVLRLIRVCARVLV